MTCGPSALVTLVSQHPSCHPIEPRPIRPPIPPIADRNYPLRELAVTTLSITAGLSREAMAEGTHQVSEWITAGKIHFDIEQVPLQVIENIWKRTDFGGKRIVVIP